MVRRFKILAFAILGGEGNKAADWMAIRGLYYDSPTICFPPYNVDFSFLVRKNILGWPHDRDLA